MSRKKRRSAWGSIAQVSRLKHVIRWVENTPEGRRRRCFTFYGTYAEAKLWLDRKHVECADRGDRPVPTVGKAYEMWWKPSIDRKLETKKLKPRTHRQYERVWEKWAKGRWYNVPVTEIKPDDVQEWLLTMPKGDALTVMVVMKGIMDFAVRYEVAPSNKFRIKYEMPNKTSERSKDVLCLVEAEKQLRGMRGKTLEAAFIVACFGGARPAEALAVRTDELRMVDSSGVRMALVPILRQANDRGDGILEWSKTNESRRFTIVPEPYCDRLIEIAGSCGTPWLTDRGDGRPINTGIMWHRWKAEAPGCVPFANLRPSWRTFAEIDWKIPYDILEIIMGHKLQGVTGRHYLRPSEDDIVRSFAEAYAAYLGKVR